MTWKWECLLDGASGMAATHDDAVVAAQAHNEVEGHDADAISYSHDEPPYDPTEAQWAAIRETRDVQLQQTDWTVTQGTPPDLPSGVKSDLNANLAAWKSFRQELRDLPASAATPPEIVWPVPPAAPVVQLRPPPTFDQPS